MKKTSIGVLAAFATFIALTPNLNAAPNTDFTWTEPTNYEDATVIPATDSLSYTLYCSNVAGGPYTVYGVIGTDTTSAIAVDLNTCVNGVPGTYYFVLTATSADFNAESAYSNEATRTYTAADLGKVPLPPVIVSVN